MVRIVNERKGIAMANGPVGTAPEAYDDAALGAHAAMQSSARAPCMLRCTICALDSVFFGHNTFMSEDAKFIRQTLPVVAPQL